MRQELSNYVFFKIQSNQHCSVVLSIDDLKTNRMIYRCKFVVKYHRTLMFYANISMMHSFINDVYLISNNEIIPIYVAWQISENLIIIIFIIYGVNVYFRLSSGEYQHFWDFKNMNSTVFFFINLKFVLHQVLKISKYF